MHLVCAHTLFFPIRWACESDVFLLEQDIKKITYRFRKVPSQAWTLVKWRYRQILSTGFLHFPFLFYLNSPPIRWFSMLLGNVFSVQAWAYAPMVTYSNHVP